MQHSVHYEHWNEMSAPSSRLNTTLLDCVISPTLYWDVPRDFYVLSIQQLMLNTDRDYALLA
jgi:hypothetical protein